MAPAPRPPQLNDRQWLADQYHRQRKSTPTIARELGCVDRTVILALRRLGIPVRDAGQQMPAQPYGKLNDPDWLADCYKVWTITEIAQECSVARLSVRRWLRFYNVDPDGRIAHHHRSRAARKWRARKRAEQNRTQARQRRERDCQQKRIEQRQAQGNREQQRVDRLIADAERQRQAAERARIEQEAAPLAEAMRDWLPANEPPLATLRLVLVQARMCGAEFAVAWHASHLAVTLDGYRGAVEDTRHEWRRCYERAGRSLDFS